MKDLQLYLDDDRILDLYHSNGSTMYKECGVLPSVCEEVDAVKLQHHYNILSPEAIKSPAPSTSFQIADLSKAVDDVASSESPQKPKSPVPSTSAQATAPAKAKEPKANKRKGAGQKSSLQETSAKKYRKANQDEPSTSSGYTSKPPPKHRSHQKHRNHRKNRRSHQKHQNHLKRRRKGQ